MLLERVLRFNSSLRHVVIRTTLVKGKKMEKVASAVLIKQENVPQDEEGIQKLAERIEMRLNQSENKVPLLGIVGMIKRVNSKHLPQVERLSNLLECKVEYTKVENVGRVESRWAEEAGIDYEWRVANVGLCSGDTFTIEYFTK